MKARTPKNVRRCRSCKKQFEPRNKLQIYCVRESCRRARHLRYMQRYMPRWKERHPDYWKTDKQREYLRRWRQAHPEYFRLWRERERLERAKKAREKTRLKLRRRRVPQHV